MGSGWPLLINSIRVMESSLNFETAISAITALDILISHGDHIPLSYKHGKVISSLFNYILHDKLDEKLNEYICKTFELFTRNKQEITIILRRLDRYNKYDDGKLVDLLVRKIKAFDVSEDYKMNVDNVNILRPEIFSIFPNVKHVTIVAADSIENKNYIFSLCQLLAVIENTRVNTVKIWSSDWIKKLWKSSSGIFVEKYAKKHFNITLTQYQGLIIKRNN